LSLNDSPQSRWFTCNACSIQIPTHSGHRQIWPLSL
jgi:hypothetical protein